MDTVPFYSQPVWFAALYLMAARIRLHSPDCAAREERRRHALCAIVWGYQYPGMGMAAPATVCRNGT